MKWAKLRGTPGSPPEKLSEAEREVNEAEARLRDSKIAYEVTVTGTGTDRAHLTSLDSLTG